MASQIVSARLFSCLIMELLLFFTIIFSSILNILFLKYFLHQFLVQLNAGSSVKTFNLPFQRKVNKEIVDESKNEIMETNDDVEFSENNPIDLPKDVKFEIEGGDTFAPSTYPEERIIHATRK